jgi:drug/metabolite transporter (DMT)-like permease
MHTDRKDTYTVQFFADSMERKLMITAALMFAVATFFLWGTNNFLMGHAEKTYNIDPRVFTAVMWMTMGVLGVVLFVYLRATGQPIHFDSKLLFPIVCGVLLGVGILTFSFAMGDENEMKGPIAAVATSNAVFTAVLAFVFLRENLSIQQWAGIATVIAGIVLMRI